MVSLLRCHVWWLVRTVALTVRTRFLEPLRHFERCAALCPWFGCAVLLWKQLQWRPLIDTDVSEYLDMATVSTQCASVTPRVDVDLAIGKEKGGARKA